MNRFFERSLGRVGILLLAVALLTVGILAATDVAHGFQMTGLHSRLGSAALIVIGASYVSLQVVSRRPRQELLKGVVLGAAFVLWGTEQLLPASRWTTAMDSAVIAIFVVDLGMIILAGFERPGS